MVGWKKHDQVVYSEIVAAGIVEDCDADVDLLGDRYNESVGLRLVFSALFSHTDLIAEEELPILLHTSKYRLEKMSSFNAIRVSRGEGSLRKKKLRLELEAFAEDQNRTRHKV